MDKEKNPKMMTILAMKMERVRLGRQIDDLKKVVDQPSVAGQIKKLKRRRQVLKTELLHRHLAREASQRAETEASTQVESPDQPDLFMTADGSPYRP